MRRRLRRTSALGALAAATLIAARVEPAQAQDARRATTPAPAATLSADFEDTERRLFEAARRAPRNPAVRAALGEWLAARGQLRSGAVLLEEARLFGGDASAIASRLAHVYTWLGDWSSLAALPASPLSPDEKERARVLTDRATGASGADTTQLAFAPLGFGALGRVPMVIGTDTVWAEVDPQEEGIALPGLRRGVGLVELSGDDNRGPIGIVRAVSLGEIVLQNVPVRIDAQLSPGRARLGFDVFARLAPTVDARAGMVTLRRSGRVEERANAAGVPFLLGFPGVRLALRTGESPVPVASPAGRAALRGGPWTVDLRRGIIWLDAAR